MLIVAELSANHLGSLSKALDLVEEAAACGADAVKIQTWKKGMMTLDRKYVIHSGPWEGAYLYDLYEQCHTPWEWHKDIFDVARDCGIECFASVFDAESLEFLESLNCPRYKIASFELTDLPLIRKVAQTGKPLVLSTGMATLNEIRKALDAAGKDVTLLKCTSAYPASPEAMNLNTMLEMRGLGVSVGLSDHSEGIAVAVTAAALGACMIEKHLTIDRREGGPDASFSMEPDEFSLMVRECRRAEKVMGGIRYGGESTDLRRSLYFSRSMKIGEEVCPLDVRTARPALGLPPAFMECVMGRRMARNVRRGEPVTLCAFIDVRKHRRRYAPEQEGQEKHEVREEGIRQEEGQAGVPRNPTRG